MKKRSFLIVLILVLAGSNFATYYIAKKKWYAIGCWKGVTSAEWFIDKYGLDTLNYTRSKGLSWYTTIKHTQEAHEK